MEVNVRAEQHIYEARTRQIVVRVRSNFEEEHSSPEEHYYFWSYHIEIENTGAEPVQLRARYWRITDGRGVVQEVRGPGVVGEEPVIAPGECYRYTSGAPLQTSSGFMEGHYEMEDSAGQRFQARIPLFSLDSPYVEHKLH